MLPQGFSAPCLLPAQHCAAGLPAQPSGCLLALPLGHEAMRAPLPQYRPRRASSVLTAPAPPTPAISATTAADALRHHLRPDLTQLALASGPAKLKLGPPPATRIAASKDTSSDGSIAAGHEIALAHLHRPPAAPHHTARQQPPQIVGINNLRQRTHPDPPIKIKHQQLRSARRTASHQRYAA
ncbi:hypothetical protein J5N97_011798 [Dioscorea zingiberensis]|uniref:Uncharacterized protein n=1 Tax=Dioscorea zingiberensis TaxID=325984 RepID=A0A9D5D3R0_9LILI|nr:hypothetical protein J5N97_011798 [Dioscorea zingiberensis]